MPFLRYNTSSHIQQDDAALKIGIRVGHVLRLGDNSGPQQCYNLKKPPPASVDVFSHSDLAFILSATLDGRRLTKNSMQRSLVSQHFVEMLRKNATLLGINSVSEPYIDESDNDVKVNVTPQRSVPVENPGSQLALVSIYLTYNCRSLKENTNTKQASLQCSSNLELFNQVVGRLLRYHIIKRYPLIFGPLGERLEREKLYFPSIARSIFSMVRLSPNNEFRRKVSRYIKILRKRLLTLNRETAEDLRECWLQLAVSDDSPNEAPDPQSDESVICDSLQHLFKIGHRPSMVWCMPVDMDAIGMRGNNRSLETTNQIESFQIEALPFDINDDDDDLIYDSETESRIALDSEANWSFLSKPPLHIGAIVESHSGINDLGDLYESGILDEDETSGPTQNSSASHSHLEILEDILYTFAEQHSQDYSNISDSDTDSLRTFYSPTLSSTDVDFDSDITSTQLSSTEYEMHSFESSLNAQASHGGRKTHTNVSPADSSSDQFVFSTIAPQSPLQSFLQSNPEPNFNHHHTSLSPTRSSVDELFSHYTSIAPTHDINYTLRVIPVKQLHSSITSDSAPITKIQQPSFAFSERKDTDMLGLEFAEEADVGFELCDVWGAKMGEELSQSSLHRTPSAASRGYKYVEKAAQSGDQAFSQECAEGRAPGIEPGPSDLQYYTSNRDIHTPFQDVLEDDFDLCMDYEGSLTEIAACAGDQDEIGTAVDEMETEMMLDTEDNDEGECSGV